MSVSGLCELCGATPIEDGCDRCGQLVCIDHFDEATGLCTKCLAEFGRGPSDEEREEKPDGVDEYQF